jgi:hypothetical protein
MSDLHPAVVYLLAAHARAEGRAAMATPGPWKPKRGDDGDDEVYTVHDGPHGDMVGDIVAYVRGQEYRGVQGRTMANKHLIATMADPVEVLRRVAAEREILAEHGVDEGRFCRCCARWLDIPVGQQVEPDDAVDWPCRTVLGLAKAWGWEEQK